MLSTIISYVSKVYQVKYAIKYPSVVPYKFSKFGAFLSVKHKIIVSYLNKSIFTIILVRTDLFDGNTTNQQYYNLIMNSIYTYTDTIINLSITFNFLNFIYYFFIINVVCLYVYNCYSNTRDLIEDYISKKHITYLIGIIFTYIMAITFIISFSIFDSILLSIKNVIYI